ncbi:MAG: cytochrome c [Burkholderiaceae bacterium]|jgi:mono/diheme cytochrome c family protein
MKTLHSILLGLFLVAPAVVNAAAPADDATVARGAYLAQAGDCTSCHTAPGGKAFAGGLPMNTPMGKVYTTNITPDSTTGIGQYSQADFARALREGLARDGHNLYPAMPYPSFAKLRDDDVAALYAYFMKQVAPVNQANRPTTIPFPLNMRWPLKLWNLVFLKSETYKDKPNQSAAWNRGAYLVQGLGHCGACHTPRGLAYNEKGLDETSRNFLRGALLDGWYASDLGGEPAAGLGRWSDGDLAAFLKSGANGHASAFGSMTDVINNSTQYLSDADVAAMTTYLKSIAPRAGATPAYVYDPKPTVAALTRPAGNAGATLYATYCMGCHGVDGKAFAPYLAPLAGNPNVIEGDPTSSINVTLYGSHALILQGIPAAYPMPSFRAVMSDREVADVLSFIRQGWNNQASSVTTQAVAKIRHEPGSEN